MVKPTDILKISEPIEFLYEDCAAELIINLARHFREGFALDLIEWESKKLGELGILTNESIQIIARIWQKTPAAVTKAVFQGAGLALKDADKILSGAASAGKTIIAPNNSWDASERVKAVMSALSNRATDHLNVVCQTMLKSTLDRYTWAVNQISQGARFPLSKNPFTKIQQSFGTMNRQKLEEKLGIAQKALNVAATDVALGVENRVQAVRRTISQLADQGITGFVDKAGRKWSPEAYVNMVVQTTVHNAAIDGQRERAADYGINTFQISSHLGARPKCEPFQGKFYSWSGDYGQVEDLNGQKYVYEPIQITSYGEPDGIFGINCHHFANTFISGYSLARFEPVDPVENARVYQESQQQRYLERQIRYEKTKALALDAAGDTQGFQESALRIRAKQADYRNYCSAHGLTPRTDRTQVVAFNKDMSQKASQAVNAAMQAQKQIFIYNNPKVIETPFMGERKAPVVQGKDIASEWHRRKGFDYAVEDIIEAQGYDGVPTVLSPKAFDEAVKKANGGKGFVAQRTYAAPDKDTLDAWREQLYNGEWYVDCSTGGAQYGKGMYCAADYTGKLSDGIKGEMEWYIDLGQNYRGNKISAVETLTLDPSAKIIKFKDLKDMRSQDFREKEVFKYLDDLFPDKLDRSIAYASFMSSLASNSNESWKVADSFLRYRMQNIDKITSDQSYKVQKKIDQDKVRKLLAQADKLEKLDDGAYAAIKGYDVINAEGHGRSGSYTVILNRTKVILKGKNK